MFSLFPEVRRVIGTEYRVILMVAVGLLLGEAGMRMIQDHLSIDVGHLRSFRSKSDELTSAAEHPQVLFLGNSMTRHGITPDIFEEEFAACTGVHPATIKINPDNTALADWFYAYRNYFYKLEHAPDVLVLGFEGGHLRDKPTLHPGRLAQYYCQPDDWPELCRYDLKTFEERMSYLVCSVSAMCSNRDRLQRRVLDTLIPGYRDGSQQLNQRQTRLAEQKLPAPTYHRLQEFLDMIHSQHVTLVLAAMPIATPYELDPELLQVIAQNRVQLLDCRNLPGIVPEMFPDGVHMTADASLIYSRYLADQLSQEPIPRSYPPRVPSLSNQIQSRNKTLASRPESIHSASPEFRRAASRLSSIETRYAGQGHGNLP